MFTTAARPVTRCCACVIRAARRSPASALESARVLACAPLDLLLLQLRPPCLGAGGGRRWRGRCTGMRSRPTVQPFAAGPGADDVCSSVGGSHDAAGSATTDVTGVRADGASRSCLAQINVQVTWRLPDECTRFATPAKSPALCPSHRTRCDRCRCRIAGAWARHVRGGAFVSATLIIAERAAAVTGQPVVEDTAAPYTPAI